MNGGKARQERIIAPKVVGGESCGVERTGQDKTENDQGKEATKETTGAVTTENEQ